MFSFEIFSLLALGAAAWFWFDTNRAREAGVQAAKSSCMREGVQLLDDTVAFRSLRLTRDDDGRVALKRVYDFEYSGSGHDRHRGSVMLIGCEVVMLDISEHFGRRLDA
jgi:hypothetical protein